MTISFSSENLDFDWVIDQTIKLKLNQNLFSLCYDKLVLHTNYRFISLNFTLYAHKQKSEILVISYDCSICDGSFLSRIYIFMFIVKRNFCHRQWRKYFSLRRKYSYKTRPSVKRGSGENLCWNWKIRSSASYFMME